MLKSIAKYSWTILLLWIEGQLYFGFCFLINLSLPVVKDHLLHIFSFFSWERLGRSLFFPETGSLSYAGLKFPMWLKLILNCSFCLSCCMLGLQTCTIMPSSLLSLKEARALFRNKDGKWVWVHGFSLVLWKLYVRMVNAGPVSIGKAISKKKKNM